MADLPGGDNSAETQEVYYLLTLLEGFGIIVILLIATYRRSVWII